MLLRDALAAARIAHHDELPTPEAAAAVITAAEGNGAVAIAKANFDANLAAIQAAWNAATVNNDTPPPPPIHP